MAAEIDRIHAISIATVALYRETELKLLTLIARYLADGIDAPTWAENRLAAVSALRRAAELTLGELETNTAPEIRQHLTEAYRTGYGAALTALQLEQVTADAARAATATVTRVAAMESLASAVISDVGERSRNVLRHVIDVYRAVVLQSAGVGIAGGLTRRQASQDAFARFVAQGVTSFTDVRGRTWRLSSYVEMALRTVTQRAAVQGQTDRLESLGVDLVTVSDSPGECPLCRPWEGKVLSISGAPGKRARFTESLVDERGVGPVMTSVPFTRSAEGETVMVEVAGSLAEAMAAGLLHPNCTHIIRAYLPGATQLPKGDLSDPELNEAKVRQREIERHIRGWKEREVAALTPEAKTSANRKVKAWQAAMRKHLEENPKLKRLPYREQPGAGNLPPKQRTGQAADPSPTPSGPQPAIRNSLRDADTVAGVDDAFTADAERITGRRIPSHLADGQDIDSAREHAEGVLRVLERYPEAKLAGLGSMTNSGLTAEARNGRILFDLKYASPEGRAEYLQVIADNNVEGPDGHRGGVPRTPIEVAIHEMGHIIDVENLDKVMHDQVYEMVRQLAAERGIDPLEFAKTISVYGSSRASEGIAEALTDVMVHGDGAADLSRRIVAMLDTRYHAKVADLGVVVRPDLADAATSLDVELLLRREIVRITGRDIVVNFGTDVDVETVREHAEGVLAMLERFPGIPLAAIDWTDSRNGGRNSMATTDHDVVRFNLRWSAQRDQYLAELRRSAQSGWHPKDSQSPATVAMHELAHVMHNTVTDQDGLEARIREFVASWAGNAGLNVDEYIRREVSEYATHDLDELVASAVVDVMVHGDGASYISRGIVHFLTEAHREGSSGRRGGHQHAEPSPEAGRYHRNLDGIEDLAELVEHGRIVDQRPMTGGGSADTYLVTFADGRRMVRKRSRSAVDAWAVAHADAAQLGSLGGRALGTRAPRIYRRDPREFWQEYVDAPSIEHLLRAAPNRAAQEAVLDRLVIAIDSDEGWLTGLLDLMSAQGDRSLGNVLLDENGLVPIDQDLAWRQLMKHAHRPPFQVGGQAVPSSTHGPFALAYGSNGRWNDNPLTREDIAEVRRRWSDLRPDFELLGQGDWLDFALGWLTVLEPYAHGSRSLVAGR